MKNLILTVAICLFLPLTSKANPPKKITLSYSLENKTLKVDVFHSVKNTEKHYIDMITIEVNGKEVKSLKFLKQSNKNGEIAEVIIPEMVSGCNVTVKASCNEFGSKKFSMKL